MKKLIALLVLIAVAFSLSACGPNSDYYNLGSKKFYYYTDEALVVNPYQLLIDNSDWLDISVARTKTPENFYEVKVEYRKSGSHDSFEELELIDSMIKFENPYQEVGSNKSYDFKIHFIENKDEENMVNYYGVFTFAKSPANAKEKVLNNSVNGTYTLLNNVLEYNPLNDSPYTNTEIASIYDITYTVTLGEDSITVTDGVITFVSAGTYHVNINLAIKASDSTDAVSGASDAGASDKMILDIQYTIIVIE